MFVGVAEVGKMKYKGAPCSSPEDAKQSAAAVANSHIPVSHFNTNTIVRPPSLALCVFSLRTLEKGIP